MMTKMSKKYRNIAAGIAASLVILLGAGTTYAYNTPVANISLDVNPSVTYSVNWLDKVIGVDTSKPDDEAILQTIQWNGENINKVVNDTIAALKKADFLENEEWYIDSIVIGVNATSTDKEDQLILAIKEELAKIVEEETDKEIDIADLDLDESVIGIGAKRVKEAARFNEEHDIAVTPGKLNLVEKLDASYTELDESFLSEDDKVAWLERPVKEIMAQIKENRLALKGKTSEGTDNVLTDDSKTNDNGNNSGNGNGNVNSNVNNNGNGNINSNGIGEGNADDENTDGLDNAEGNMEKERKVNVNQNGLSHGAIKTENN